MFIKECMTKSPYTVGVDTLLLKARELLSEHDIRHLPVLDEKKLVGILSDGNLKQALASPGGERFLAADAMMPDAFAVTPETELATVVEEMARKIRLRGDSGTGWNSGRGFYNRRCVPSSCRVT